MKYLLISILFLTSLSVFSQGTMATNNASNQNTGATNSTASAKSKKSHELPESLVNLEVQSEILGTGIDFLGGGVKAMIGSKNTGLLLGFIIGSNSLSDTTYNSFRLGYQYGVVRGFYANANFNLASIKSIDLYATKYRSIRVNLGIGYTLSFGKKKRLYYNIETAFAAININSLLPRFAIYSGIGFRLGTPAKTSYEGVKNVTTVPMK
jgi:hypothetical protein